MNDINDKVCAYCGRALPDRVRFMCMPHWDALPAMERKAVSRMDRYQQDLKTKLAKCVRILTEKLGNPDTINLRTR
jgi:hypothetical protein